MIRIAAAVGLASVGLFAAMKWTAKLAPQDTYKVAGSATVDAGASSTKATVELTGGDPGATYPWHVHSGKCGDNGPVVGEASAYTPIKISKSGTGKVDVTLPFTIPDNGSYYINIHHSASDMKTIVSCGDLSMGM